MLDLGELTQQFYQIKMINGEIINIKKPSEKLLRKLFKLQNISENEQAIDAMYEILVEVLNNNVNKKVFNKDEILDSIDVGTASLVIQDYLEQTVDITQE